MLTQEQETDVHLDLYISKLTVLYSAHKVFADNFVIFLFFFF